MGGIHPSGGAADDELHQHDPVSLTLAYGESTTVPAGETWRVTVTAAGNGNANFVLNGEEVVMDSANSGNPAATTVETTVVGGDVLKNNSGSSSTGSVHIGGFKV
jgi:hypothetical protein